MYFKFVDNGNVGNITSAEIVENFEKRHKISFPKELREYYKAHNGASIKENAFSRHGIVFSIDFIMPLTGANVCVEKALRKCREGGQTPLNLVPFAEDVEGDTLYWDMEVETVYLVPSGTETTIPISESIGEFFEILERACEEKQSGGTYCVDGKPILNKTTSNLKRKKRVPFNVIVYSLIPTAIIIAVALGLPALIKHFTPVEYTSCSVEQMKYDLAHGGNVEGKYLEKTISVKGRIEEIEDDNISLEIIEEATMPDIEDTGNSAKDLQSMMEHQESSQYDMLLISCYAEDAEQLQKFGEMKVGEIVTVEGKVFAIWAYGYLMDIHNVIK